MINFKNIKAQQNDMAFNNVWLVAMAGIPQATDAVGSGKGSLCVDTTNGKLYINIGTVTTPSWQLVGVQA